jgi:GT2 family glycosyltransferase
VSGPDVSIVVVTHNEGDALTRTLSRLRSSTARANVEFVVVDDASSDSGARPLTGRWSDVEFVRSEQRLGIARARNLGASVANGSVIVFSDAHVEPDEGWVEPLCQELDQAGVAAVAPAIGGATNDAVDGYGFSWRRPDLAMQWLTEKPERPGPIPFVCGCFLAVRRDAFEECDGFDEGLLLWGWEDAELSLRLWRRGWECRVVPDSRIVHHFRKHFPYEMPWESLVHNVLRTATVHLDERGLAAVIDHYAPNPGFPRAGALLAASDVWHRRERVRASSPVSTAAMLERFSIDAVA